MNNPIYEPPKLKTIFNNASDNIVARLKIAKTTPVIEIQFRIEEGSFMVLLLMHMMPTVNNTFEITKWMFTNCCNIQVYEQENGNKESQC